MALTPRRLEAPGRTTLIEMLIAVALLGIVLLGIAPLFISSMRFNYSAFEYTSIHNLARDRLEQLMNLPFDNQQLAQGAYVNDLPTTMPDPATGIPPSNVKNMLERTYSVDNFTTAPPLAAGRQLHPDGRRGGNAVRLQADRRHRPLDHGRHEFRDRRAHRAGVRPPPEPRSREQLQLEPKTHAFKRTRRRESGFTLVEMIVVTMLLAIAMVGLLAVFDASARINKNETDVADAQGAVRYGLYQMTRAIRMAGAGGLYVTQAVLNHNDRGLTGIAPAGASYDNAAGVTVTDTRPARPMRCARAPTSSRSGASSCRL